MKTTSRRLVVVFLLIGLAASAYALYVHYWLLMQPGYASPCDINETVSCSHVYLSPYGSVRGVPVALLGVIWFVFVALLAIGGTWGPAPLRENLPGYLFAVSTVGLAVILYLAYAAFFVLKAICLLCLTTYLGVIGLFLVSGIATPFPMTTLPRRLLGDLRALVTSPVALILSVLFIAGSVSAMAFFPREGSRSAVPPPVTTTPAQQNDQRSELDRYLETAPRMTVPVSNDGAAVPIVKFSDYACPACGQTHFAYKSILARWQAAYPGAVKMVTKDFPLNTDCNPTLQRTTRGHEGSCDAAVAVLLAGRQKRDAEMQDWLFANQQILTPLVVRQAAGTVGRVADWEAAYARAFDMVKGDAALGRLLHVSVTPTFFINGVKFDGPFTSPDLFDAAIAFELKRAGKIK